MCVHILLHVLIPMVPNIKTITKFETLELPKKTYDLILIENLYNNRK